VNVTDVSDATTRRMYAVRLWSINRWLRWTGWRLFVSVASPGEDEPTRLGFVFYGWRFVGVED
jgi:hypothetical protein